MKRRIEPEVAGVPLMDFEGRGQFDAMGLMQQIGAIPAPEGA
ncbi:MAG: hypothetical protein ACRDTR_12070 [Rubrobacter sp.]